MNFLFDAVRFFTSAIKRMEVKKKLNENSSIIPTESSEREQEQARLNENIVLNVKPSNADKSEQKSNMSEWRRVQLSYLLCVCMFFFSSFLHSLSLVVLFCRLFGVIFKNILLKFICTVSLVVSSASIIGSSVHTNVPRHQ